MMEQDEGKAFYEDFSSDQIKQTPNKLTNMKKILIIAAISAIIILAIILILILTQNKKKQSKLGSITCIYSVNSLSEMTQIISDEYKKNSKFDIVVEDKIIPYNKQYKFLKEGENIVKYELYEDIPVAKMFKNISALISVELNTDNNLKILSIESAFENCENLVHFGMKGFNTDKIQSLSKIFYGCKQLDYNLEGFNALNIKDISYILAETSISTFDFSKINTDNVVNMSHMFYKCDSLTNVIIENANIEKVEDMSYMFAFCESLTNLNFKGINTEKVKDMSHIFQNCLSLTSLNIDNFN